MSNSVRRWIPYRKTLTTRAQSLRRDPTPAEKKLWYEFLRDLPHKFTRQKPLGRYVADFYCSRCRLVIEPDGIATTQIGRSATTTPVPHR
jgi:very-short-patch-repair endonuclease